MSAHEFTFIHVPPPGRSRRAQKLATARAKSHAAYVGYYRHQSRTNAARKSKAGVSFECVEDPALRRQSCGRQTGGEQIGNPWASLFVATESCESSAGSSLTESPCSTEKNSDNGAISQSMMAEPHELIPVPQYKQSLIFTCEPSAGLRIDPFFTAPTTRASTDLALIDFFARDIGPINESVSWVFNVANIATGQLEIISRQSFYPTILCILQSMEDQLRNPGSSPSSELLRRKGNAMANVRKELGDQNGTKDDGVLCAILLLAVLEGSFQSNNVREVHRRTLSVIASQRGGLNGFADGSVFKASLMQFDTFWTWETGRTMFPGQRRRHDPVYPSNPASLKSIQDLPVGFRDLFVQGILSFDLLPVLRRAVQFTNVPATKRIDFLLGVRSREKAFNDFWEACPCVGFQNDDYHPLERLLTMSILYFIYGTFEVRAFPTGPGGPAPGLPQRLIAYRAMTQAEDACLQWMWIVAIDILWADTGRRNADSFSMSQLQSRYPQFRSMEAALSVGKNFLWTSAMTISVQSYWRNVINPHGPQDIEDIEEGAVR